MRERREGMRSRRERDSISHTHKILKGGRERAEGDMSEREQRAREAIVDRKTIRPEEREYREVEVVAIIG